MDSPKIKDEEFEQKKLKVNLDSIKSNFILKKNIFLYGKN